MEFVVLVSIFLDGKYRTVVVLQVLRERSGRIINERNKSLQEEVE